MAEPSHYSRNASRRGSVGEPLTSVTPDIVMHTVAFARTCHPAELGSSPQPPRGLVDQLRGALSPSADVLSAQIVARSTRDMVSRYWLRDRRLQRGRGRHDAHAVEPAAVQSAIATSIAALNDGIREQLARLVPSPGDWKRVGLDGPHQLEIQFSPHALAVFELKVSTRVDRHAAIHDWK